MLFDTYSTLYM